MQRSYTYHFIQIHGWLGSSCPPSLTWFPSWLLISHNHQAMSMYIYVTFLPHLFPLPLLFYNYTNFHPQVSNYHDFGLKTTYLLRFASPCQLLHPCWTLSFIPLWSLQPRYHPDGYHGYSTTECHHLLGTQLESFRGPVERVFKSGHHN